MLCLIKIYPDLGKDGMKHSTDLAHRCPEIFYVFQFLGHIIINEAE